MPEYVTVRSFTDAEIAHIEAGRIVSTCDWGYCSREADLMRRDSLGNWLPVCKPCAYFAEDSGNLSLGDALCALQASRDRGPVGLPNYSGSSG